MSKYTVTDSELKSVADAIREKTHKNGTLSFPVDFVSEIGSITTEQPESPFEEVTLAFSTSSAAEIKQQFEALENNNGGLIFYLRKNAPTIATQLVLLPMNNGEVIKGAYRYNPNYGNQTDYNSISIYDNSWNLKVDNGDVFYRIEVGV